MVALLISMLLLLAACATAAFAIALFMYSCATTTRQIDRALSRMKIAMIIGVLICGGYLPISLVTNPGGTLVFLMFLGIAFMAHVATLVAAARE